jgi:hypothetical protein
MIYDSVIARSISFAKTFNFDQFLFCISVRDFDGCQGEEETKFLGQIGRNAKTGKSLVVKILFGWIFNIVFQASSYLQVI